MQRVPMVDCGDGVRRADNGMKFFGTSVNAKTANYTVKAVETGQAFSNKGATGTVQFTLPTPKAGLKFVFLVVAAQTFEVLPSAGGEKINNGSTKISAAGTQANLGVAEVFSDGTNWFCSLTGTWTTT